ncbi:ribonuclease R [Bdellovibrionota bacterium]
MDKNKVIAFFKRKPSKEYTFEELFRGLKISKSKRRRFRKLVRDIVRDGLIVRHGRVYALPRPQDLFVGTVSKHPRGFAFVMPNDPSLDDVFLNRREAQSLMNKDQVQVSVRVRSDGRTTGKLLKVIERGQTKIVGVLIKEAKHYFVIPHGIPREEETTNRLFIPPKFVGEAKDGEVVVAEIRSYPTQGRLGEGKITRVLGRAGDPGIDTDVILYKHDLPHEFPKAVLNASKNIPSKVQGGEIKGRRDLRTLPLVTIDNATAKDFDDAVFVKKTKEGFTLWVAIADVSHYVKEDSAIDQEAWKRGTSIYFPDRVVPMLPESLSNEICSLKPNVDRLAFTCEMKFDKAGSQLNAKIYESVIRSKHRLTYSEVIRMMEGDEEVLKKYRSYVPHLEDATKLYRLLKKKRAARGSLDFDLPEAQLILDVRGKIEQIIKTPRTDANMLIEEFMIAANEAVAEMIEESETPGIFRVHEPPKQEALHLFQGLLHNLGYNKKFGEKVQPKDLEAIIEWAEGRPEKRLVNTVLLRSLKQALYQRENAGHFGLASTAYSHFTSPIRRFPDLLLHRLLKNLKKSPKPADKKLADLQSLIDEAAAQSSKAERLAMGAEREVVALKKCRFMMDKVGEEYWGYIEGVTDFGIFVELEQWFVEGLVRFTSMEDDVYIFVEEEYIARGRHTKNTLRLGDRVKVRVDAVKIHQREIDFTLVESD